MEPIHIVPSQNTKGDKFQNVKTKIQLKFNSPLYSVKEVKLIQNGLECLVDKI